MRIARTSVGQGLLWVRAQVRRPETLAFMPAITLAAYWWGGEGALILTALGIPLVYVMIGAILPAPAPTGLVDGLQGLVQRPQVTAILDAILRGDKGQGQTTACLVILPDEAARMLDRHGRAFQTELLERLSDRICGVLRQGDTVARLEGGGFAVALAPVARLDLETLVQIAGRLQASVAAPVMVEGASCSATVSVGFCLVARAPERSGRALLDAAQLAADEALRNGPGAIRSYAAGMARVRADRTASRDVLERALDEGQIRPFFQPQVSTDTGAISGFEALARWHHPDRGLVSPAEFLPALEEAGLSERLGEVILYHALAALANWDKAGCGISTVAVNFSPEELRNPRLPDRIKWELDRFDLEPKRLTIEILETVVTQTDNDVLVRNVAALSALGCGIDLDDFGTGHASITNIRRFALRRLKIDRSFVARVDEDPEQQKMVGAILAMAERLGLDTLAEGVETPGEHAILSQLGCGHVQGFGIARPMPFEETADWIQRHRARLSAAPKITHRAG